MTVVRAAPHPTPLHPTPLHGLVDGVPTVLVDEWQRLPTSAGPGSTGVGDHPSPARFVRTR